MRLESFNKVTFQYDTGPIPPPFCYRYNFMISTIEDEKHEVDIEIDYYDRDEISEDEIYNEGFSMDDNFHWSGDLPQIWVQEIINKLNTSNWKKQMTLRPGETGMMVKIDTDQSAEDLEPADLRIWEVFVQEIIQACFELSEREAPLHIEFIRNDSAKHRKQLKITYSFALRTVGLVTNSETEKTLSWENGRKLLKYIYGIDYLPENGISKAPTAKGSYISPGDGLWYLLETSLNGTDELPKIEKLKRLLEEYLD